MTEYVHIPLPETLVTAVPTDQAPPEHPFWSTDQVLTPSPQTTAPPPSCVTAAQHRPLSPDQCSFCAPPLTVPPAMIPGHQWSFLHLPPQFFDPLFWRSQPLPFLRLSPPGASRPCSWQDRHRLQEFLPIMASSSNLFLSLQHPAGTLWPDSLIPPLHQPHLSPPLTPSPALHVACLNRAEGHPHRLSNGAHFKCMTLPQEGQGPGAPPCPTHSVTLPDTSSLSSPPSLVSAGGPASYFPEEIEAPRKDLPRAPTIPSTHPLAPTSLPTNELCSYSRATTHWDRAHSFLPNKTTLPAAALCLPHH